MKLYVMRHGPAEDESPAGGDFTRALTAAGRDRVRDVARRLQEIGEAPKRIVSSPLVRALQTAEIVQETLAIETPLSVDVAFAPRGGALEHVRAAKAAGKKRLMVVGHEPDVSILVASLAGDPLDVPFAKAMVVGLAVHGDDAPASVRFVLDPKEREVRWLDRGAAR